MAKRERYNVALTCTCGAAGCQEREENENPVYDGAGSTLVKLSGPFHEKGQKIVCDQCGQEVGDA
jgi:hypothetical protein